MKIGPGLKLALGGGLLLLARSAFAGTSRTGEKAATGDARLDFVNAMWSAISRVWPSASVATKQLIVTAGSYESGWGAGTAYRLGNNAFNITKGSANIPSVDGPDTECDENGANCRPITQKFRAYASLDDGISDYLSFLQSSRYISAYDLLVAGDVGFAEALGNTGYYTQAIDTYVRNFKSVLAGVQSRLRQLFLVV